MTGWIKRMQPAIAIAIAAWTKSWRKRMRDLDTLGGDPRFLDLLWETGQLHSRKQEDYGFEGQGSQKPDPFANVRASGEFGVTPWVGALIRLNDKVTRLKAFARKGTLANESAEDSMKDISVYALISLILYREEVDRELVRQELGLVKNWCGSCEGENRNCATCGGKSVPQ